MSRSHQIAAQEAVHTSGAFGKHLGRFIEQSVPQPFEFIAADSISGDSAVVELQVWPSSGGTGASISNAGNGALKIPVGISLKRQASPEATGTTQSLTKEEKIKRLLEKVKKSLAEMSNPSRGKQSNIIQGNPKIPRQGKGSRFGRNQEIQEKLADRLEQKLAIKNEAKKSGASSQVKAKVTGKTAKFASVMQEGECTPPVDTIVIKKQDPELVLYLPDDKEQFIEGTNLPKMPKPLVKAQLKDYNDGQVEFNWRLTIKWKAKVIDFTTPLDKTEKYQGEAFGQNSDIVDLEIGDFLYGESDIRGGDEIILTVSCTTKVDGKVFSTNPNESKNPFIIKGKNPTKESLLAELNGDFFAAMAWQESRFNQFATNSKAAVAHPNSTMPEYPLQGGDLWDFGLMQIRHPDWYNSPDFSYYCDDIVWNWVANVQQAKEKFKSCTSRAAVYHARSYFSNYDPKPVPLKNIPTSVVKDENQVLLQAYCYYNCVDVDVRYWDWNPGDPIRAIQGKWEENAKSYKQPVRNSNSVWDYFTSNPKPWNK